jgi:hypothetical protein
VDGRRIEGKPGMFVDIPPNILHSFKNETDRIAKLIIVISPAGLEQLFVEAGVEVSDSNVEPPPFTEDKKQRLVKLASKYGVEMRRPSLQ